jgi:predicted AlkP superfamily phosphohydrolase/phosphomutase
MSMKRVIVIGLDGLEPKLTERFIAQGDLPNLANLKQKGGYGRVKTTTPAQTPVAWSTFATGTNPGGHGIFDFLKRDPQTYLPYLGLSRYEQKNAFTPPKAVNLRKGKAIWDVLTDAGIPSVVIRCPCTFPPEPILGKMLSGLGVPDLRGGLGSSAMYSTRPIQSADFNEKAFQIISKGNEFTLSIIGPRHPKGNQDLMVEAKVTRLTSEGKALISIDGNQPPLELNPGKWSDWLKVRFKTGMLQSVPGMLRFYLGSLEPDFELYASPVNFDPKEPLFPISAPQAYAAELEARLGTFYTLGMAEDHDGLINGRFDEEAFLEQVSFVMRDRRRMMFSELDQFTEGFFYCLYDTPDRLQHMFWRFLEPDHPANAGQQVDQFKDVIREHYIHLDAIVGKAMERVDPDTLMIVLSDHGMNSFRRGLNLNTWLFENGFLALKNGSQPGDDHPDFFQGVDWSKTKAYAIGLGCIYLNLIGREAQGIVAQDDAYSVSVDVQRGLTGLRDPQTGQIAVRSVVTRDQVYAGPCAGDSPDLLVNFAEGYRVSWGTPLGGVPHGLFENNLRRWGGDHVIDPELIPGVIFMNRGFENQGASLVDLAPTILAGLGVPKYPAMEGKDLLK